MNYKIINHKIRKYKIKINDLADDNRKSHHVEKLKYYESLLPSNYLYGGKVKDFSRMISDITSMVNETASLNEDAVSTLISGVNVLKEHLHITKTDLLQSSKAFGKYNKFVYYLCAWNL